MIIEDLDWQHYTVPFRVPFTTSQGLERSRRGILLRVTTQDSIYGYGEAVSLPGFGTGSLTDIESGLADLANSIRGRPVAEAVAMLSQDDQSTSIAPARFAVDTALLDIQSQVAGVPLSRFISDDCVSSVPVNATISDMDAEGAAKAAYYAVTAGYSAVKMKIGAHFDPTREVKRVSAVREATGPDIELRLDVNGAWTTQQTTEMAQHLSPYDVAYIEQPLPALDLGAMAQLRQQIDIPIAADESASTRPAVEEIIRLQAADVIVIKPAVVGGVTAAQELIRLAHEAGLRVVVTTALETGVAITAALHLASTLPQPVPACGLATGALLDSDLLIDPPEIRAGHMLVPKKPGLGVEPLSSVWDSTRAGS